LYNIACFPFTLPPPSIKGGGVSLVTYARDSSYKNSGKDW